MSNFLIFKAAFHNSTTPAIGTYTAEGAAAYFNRNLSISPDFYLYGNTSGSAIRWFVPTAGATDFEFVADILTTNFNGYFTYFIIADSTGTTRLRMWSLNNFVYFANDDSNAQTGTQFIGRLANTDIGGFEVFHRFRFRVRKLTESSSSVEIYVDGTLKLTATAGAALVTCAKIGFMGGVNDSVPLGNITGIQNTYLYDLSSGDVIDRGVLSGAFNRFISWMKSKFALKSDIPTVNDATLTIQQNGASVQTFTANQSTAATANIQCVDLSTAQTVAGNKTFSGTIGFTSSPGVSRANDPFYHLTTTGYDKGASPASDMFSGLRFFCNPNASVANKITGGLDMVYNASGYNSIGLNARNYDENDNHRFYTVSLRVSNNSTVPVDFVPSVSATINLGSSAAQWNNAYVKSLTVNGTAAGDILTHNASEFVDVTSAQTIAGDKDFTGTTGTHDVIPATTDTYDLGSSAKEYNNAYIKSLTVNGTAAGDILTYNASEFVPRSGGAVMTGNLAKVNDTSIFSLLGSSAANGGALINLYGKNEGSSLQGAFLLQAYDDTNAQYRYFIGYPDGTMTWFGQPIQYSSDQRLKQQISEIDDKLLDAWQDVDLVQFKYNDAVDAKGKDKARLHTGYVVQQIDTACKSHDVDISAYGLYCHEEYPEETEEVEVEQEDGTKTKERKVIREANEHYSLRYTEAYAVECKYLRRCIERLTARIEQLEKDKEQEASK